MAGIVTGTSFNGMKGFNADLPLVNGAAAPGVSEYAARIDHVHPASPASSVVFNAIQSGTNTTATMTVGTGGALGYSGGGIVNASHLGGLPASSYTALPASAAGWLHDNGAGARAWTTPSASDVGADPAGTASSAVSTHAALQTGVHGINITAGKTFSSTNTLTLSGTDGSILSIGAGGTLGTGAYATEYILPAATASVLGGVKPDGTSVLNTAGVLSVTPASIGLGNVENIALSTWAGGSNITTLGTIATGMWNAIKIGLAYGGTNADLSSTGGASFVLRQSTVGGPVTVSQLAGSEITNTPAGTIAATTVQAAINELDTEKVPSTRTIGTTAPLTGGGDLSADRTLAISPATAAAAGSMSAADKTKFDLWPTATKDFTGFQDPELVIITYDTTARTITLTGAVEAYWRGVKVALLVTGWVSAAHAATNGPWFLLYDGANFVWQNTPWTFDLMHIAYVNYGAADKFAIRECHGLMPWQVHRECHETIGTYRVSGGDLSSYTAGSTTATNRRPAVSACVIKDEDLITTNPILAAAGPYTQLSLASTGVSTFVTGELDIVSVAAARPNWNQFSTPNWVQTPMSNNSYMTIWLVAVPATASAGSQLYRFLWVQGQTNGSLSSEQGASFGSLNLGQLANLFTEFVPVARIIIQYTAGNWTITQVDSLTGSRISSVAAPSGTFLTAVAVTTPITGTGTGASPLTMPAATGLLDGYLSVSAQTIGGAKTFSSLLTASAGVTVAGKLIQTHTISGAGSDTGVSLSTIFQNTGGTVRGLLMSAVSNPSGASTAAVVGLEGSAEISATATSLTSGVLVGANCVVRVNAGTATGTLPSVRAGYFFVQNANAAVTITTATGCFIDAPSTTGPITNVFGIYIANQRQAGVTASYALSIAPQTGGGYAIMCEGAGRVRVLDTTAATSITTGAFSATGGGSFGGALWVGGLLNVAGAASMGALTAASGTFSGGISQTGTVMARFENTFVSATVGAVGVGVEIGINSGTGRIAAVNRTSTTLAPMQFAGSSFDFGDFPVSMGALTATTVKTGSSTVAALPAGTIGMRYLVTDAIAPAFGAAVVGGGAIPIPVYHDGISWKVA